MGCLEIRDLDLRMGECQRKNKGNADGLSLNLRMGKCQRKNKGNADGRQRKNKGNDNGLSHDLRMGECQRKNKGNADGLSLDQGSRSKDGGMSEKQQHIKMLQRNM